MYLLVGETQAAAPVAKATAYLESLEEPLESFARRLCAPLEELDFGPLFMDAADDPNAFWSSVADSFTRGRYLERELPSRDVLASDQLDYSMKSLELVDDWLARLHPRRWALSLEDYWCVSFGAGAYMGEVIRRHAPAAYEWRRWEDVAADNPDLPEYVPYEPPVAYLLVRNDGMSLLALTKAAKFLDDGADDSVWFFAHAEVEAAKRET
jgi:hypothetical protein